MMFPAHRVGSLIPLSIFLFAALPASADRIADLRQLTGAPTRVVWVQDAGELACIGAERPTLKLMGIDTEDGKGERAILPDIARYWKPQFTDDGNQIVFGDLETKSVHVVNWDGTGLKKVLDGANFEDVWTDPRTGVVWVYAKVQETRGDKTIPVIRRYQLNDPKVNELIWDKTDIYTFTLAGDGRAASGGGDGGNSPQGYVTLPNGEFRARAGGCWPSMCPDNSLRSWVFTGSHRSIHFFTPSGRDGKAFNRQIDFTKSPGLVLKGPEEVSHPRWSNHPQFFNVIGPVSEWSYRADVKIPKHVAEKVEIYLGKFNDDFTAIERWVQFTENNRGDYFPNVWIKPPPGPPAWLSAAPVVEEKEATASGELNRTGQVFLWENGAASNQLEEPSGGIFMGTVTFQGEARYARHFEMELQGGSGVPERVAPRLHAATQSGKAFAFEGMLTPQSLLSGVIFAYGDAIALVQNGEWIELELAGKMPLPLFKITPGTPYHLVVSAGAAGLTVSVNGQRLVLQDPPDVTPGAWKEGPVLFGDAPKGGQNWVGLLSGVGLFGREIPLAEARQRFEAQKTTRSEWAKNPEPLVVEAKLVGPAAGETPGGIRPYIRNLTVQQYEVQKVVKGKCDAKIIDVAQWSVLGEKVVEKFAQFKKGEIYTLHLEPWDDRPEQSPERTNKGDFEDAEKFYEVRPPIVVAPKNEGIPADLSLVKSGENLLLEKGNLGEIKITGTLTLQGNGGVTAAATRLKGLGYSKAPKVRFEGGGGKGAEAIALMSLSELELTSLGQGYTEAPLVKVSAPDVFGGRNAAAVAVIDAASKSLAQLRIVDGGSGYLNPPVVTLDGGGGSGAEITPHLSLSRVAITQQGSGYKTPPSLVIEGDGDGAKAVALLQETTFRYTLPAGGALLLNEGELTLDGSGIVFDWAAPANASAPRGVQNQGTMELKSGAVILFTSSTGRPLWNSKVENAGRLRLQTGAQFGLKEINNIGKLELGANALLGQMEFSSSDGVLSNRGEVIVNGGTQTTPAIFGLVDPQRNGKRLVENGTPDGAAKARFVIGEEGEGAFNLVGGDAVFTNHPASTLHVGAKGSLSLLTRDEGSKHLFNPRRATLLNGGDCLFLGSLRIQSNHTQEAAITNSGRLEIQGDSATIVRLPNSCGEGAAYGVGRNETRVINLKGGRIEGRGTLAHRNETPSKEIEALHLINLGTLAPGANQKTGTLKLPKATVVFGFVPPTPADPKKPTLPEGAGVLEILLSSPSDFSKVEVEGGSFTLNDGADNTLNIIAASSPKGTYRIVTAKEVKGTFKSLQLNGATTEAYSVNYLPDGIEVVFR